MNKFQQVFFDSPARTRMMVDMPIETPCTAEFKAVGDWRKPENAEPPMRASRFYADPDCSKHLRVVLGAGHARGTDRVRQFAAAACVRANGAPLRCEEKYPGTGHNSVLYVVIENNTAQAHSQLAALHQELFGAEAEDPLAPVCLHVVDRATDDALQKLVEAGLLEWTGRMSRILWPTHDAETALEPLSPAETEKAGSCRHQAARRMKVARVLIEAGMPGEARSFVLEAMLALARALAVEERLPEPETLCESLLPPFSGCWGNELPLFRRFVADEGEPCSAVMEALQTFLRS